MPSLKKKSFWTESENCYLEIVDFHKLQSSSMHKRNGCIFFKYDILSIAWHFATYSLSQKNRM